jgi:hypothetical protein
LLPELCKQLGVEEQRVRRIVLDISYSDVVTAYIELLGTDALLNVKYDGTKISIKEVGTPEWLI